MTSTHTGHPQRRETIRIPVRAAGSGRPIPGILTRSFLGSLAFMILVSAVMGLTGCHKPHSPADPIVSKPSKLDGRQAPRFTLPADNGSDISSSDFIGKSKLVLVFYRGYW